MNKRGARAGRSLAIFGEGGGHMGSGYRGLSVLYTEKQIMLLRDVIDTATVSNCNPLRGADTALVLQHTAHRTFG